jgi:uncharacterized protein involved in exopolysaccharide biosynthesis
MERLSDTQRDRYGDAAEDRAIETSRSRDFVSSPTLAHEFEPSFSLLSVLNVLLRHRGLVVVPVLLCVAVAVVVTLATPRTYSSSSAIMPQSNRATAGLSGLAAQLGVNVPVSDGGQSPAFYVELLGSRSMLEATVNSTYSVDQNGVRRSATLMDVYGVDAPTAALRRDAAMTILGRNVTAIPSQRSGVVRLTTTAPTPALAQAINARMLELVNAFNTETRKSRAGAERQFAENRLAEVRVDLMEAENRLMRFLESNRNYQNSPQLMFTQEHLNREVQRQQQLFTVLSQSYEQAKLDEVRDTPVLTTVERPSLPARPNPRGLAKRTLVAILIGATIGLFLAFLRAVVGRARGESATEYQEFVALRRQLADDLRHPRRLLRRGRARAEHRD